jgi:hypothetical protein
LDWLLRLINLHVSAPGGSSQHIFDADFQRAAGVFLGQRNGDGAGAAAVTVGVL